MDFVDSDFRRWLDDGPAAGPPSVLAAALARTRTTRQRPALVARALGAPGLPGSGLRGAPSVRLAWLVALLLVVFLASMVVIGGVFRPVPVPVVPIVPEPSAVAGTPSPSPSPTVPASASASLEPEPTPEPTPVSASGPAAPVSFPDLGFGAVPPPTMQASRVGDTVMFRPPRSGTIYPAYLRSGVVTVTVGATNAGVSFFGATTTIKGTTLSEVLAVLQGMPGATFPTNDAMTLDGESARLITLDRSFEPSSSVVVAVRGDRIYLIQAVTGLASSQFSDNADRNEGLLRTFAGGFRFIGDGTLLGSGFRIAYPDGWLPTRRANPNGRLWIGRGEFGGGASDIVSVDWADPGGAIMIGLGQDAGSAIVSGRDLASLAAATRAAFPESKLTPISIGGEPGYRVRVRQSSSIYPLASLAICWHDGLAYVFMEHLVFDGTPSGDFETILAGVTFD